MVIFTVTQVYPAHAVVPGSLPANDFCGTLQLGKCRWDVCGPSWNCLRHDQESFEPIQFFLDTTSRD